jgi:ferrochelatase
MNLMQPLLLVSYGAPERQEEVVPFLDNLFADKNVSAERKAAAARKYEQFAAQTGHYSPLNAECRKLIDGIRQVKANVPVYWGNLFWHPLLTDTVAAMARDGIERAVCFATSVFDSPSGNQRYADALESARQTIGNNAPILEKLPLAFDHPLFIEAQTDRLLETHLAGTPAPLILFLAHSIPLTDAAPSNYVAQLQSTCRAIIEKSRTPFPSEMVYQSRSGSAEHWLGPDITECITERAAEGRVESVIVSPLGFFCENMETEYDLDIEISKHCAKLGLNFFRSKAIGAMPKICRLIAELMDKQNGNI